MAAGIAAPLPDQACTHTPGAQQSRVREKYVNEREPATTASEQMMLSLSLSKQSKCKDCTGLELASPPTPQQQGPDGICASIDSPAQRKWADQCLRKSSSEPSRSPFAAPNCAVASRDCDCDCDCDYCQRSRSGDGSGRCVQRFSEIGAERARRSSQHAMLQRGESARERGATASPTAMRRRAMTDGESTSTRAQENTSEQSSSSISNWHCCSNKD